MRKVIPLAIVLSLLGWAMPSGAAAADRSYLILSRSAALPGNIAAAVRAAGGEVTRTIGQIGVAVARSSSSGFVARAAAISGVRSVVPNVTVNWIAPGEVVLAEAFGNPPTSGDDDFFFDLQWGADAVDAPEAWNAGFRGAGVRIAILDSGIDSDHPDLAPKVNIGLSTSFVPGESFNPPPGFYFHHGTHVAGIAAAADNAFGVIGIAPEAELVAVKVLNNAGSGAFEGIIAGIVYAADINADVINMSLGAVLARHGFLDDNGTPDPGDDVFVTANEVAALATAVGRATSYAYQHGTTVIASAGNDAIDGDHTADVFHLPSDAPHVISISATAPIGWAKGGNPSLDNLASYSNFGQSVISFAAPGGDFVYPGNEDCTVAGLTVPCWVFDLVFSDIPGGWGWAAGTSMAAPHASGVAAIIIGKKGGRMHPAQVEAALRASADDLGKPGNDDAYGAGRVNAGNAAN